MNYDKFAKIFITLCWAGFILALVGWPMQISLWGEKLTFYDKGVHAILFGILAYLIILCFKAEKDYPLRRAYYYSFLLSLGFTAFTEIWQNYVPGRTASELDLLAGIIGIGMAILYDFFMSHEPKPKLLIHVCCISCSAYTALSLRKEFKVYLFFYNQNIFPKEEYFRRLDEVKKVAKRLKLPLFVGRYDHSAWQKMIKGHETDPERGERCHMCYEERMDETAKLALKKKFDYFTTILSVSPHKNTAAIMEIGKKLESKYGVRFFDRDFKKQDGYKKSVTTSKEMGLYRQDYCGCEFSLRDRLNRIRERENQEKK